MQKKAVKVNLSLSEDLGNVVEEALRSYNEVKDLFEKVKKSVSEVKQKYDRGRGIAILSTKYRTQLEQELEKLGIPISSNASIKDLVDKSNDLGALYSKLGEELKKYIQ